MFNLLKEYSRRGFPSPDGRFAFTFVRDPLERFISSYTEIEYLSKDTENDIHNPHGVHMVEPLGSINRVKDFIKALLSSNASKKFLTNKEFYHLAPQIGSLLAATLIENSVRLFPLNRFGQSWQELANEYNHTLLMNIYSETQRNPHISSLDPFNTTRAASNLLLTYRKSPNVKSDGSAHQTARPHSHKYTRAICRIYLTDYLCLGMPLPAPCIGIEDELMESLRDYNEQHEYIIEPSRNGLMGYLLTVPRQLTRIGKRLFAEIICIRASSPECVSEVVLGLNSEGLEDEL